MDESVVPGKVSGGPSLVLLRRVALGCVFNPMVTLAMLCYILRHISIYDYVVVLSDICICVGE